MVREGNKIKKFTRKIVRVGKNVGFSLPFSTADVRVAFLCLVYGPFCIMCLIKFH